MCVCDCVCVIEERGGGRERGLGPADPHIHHSSDQHLSALIGPDPLRSALLSVDQSFISTPFSLRIHPV